MTGVFVLFERGDDDVKGILAVFVADEETADPRVRAEEVVFRMVAENADRDVWIERIHDVNPSNQELGIKPNLSEMDTSDIVAAAYRELEEKGEVWVPLWANPGWILHELKARYDCGLLVQVNRKIQRKPTWVNPKDDDCGFFETL